jgi:general secretion pathway protein A
MYEAHWQLDRKPFDGGLDPASYYPSETHQGALLKLRYVLENRQPAAALSGPSGTGKTLLVQMLKKQLPAEYFPFVHLVFPQLPPAQLLAYLAAELTAPSPTEGSGGLEENLRRLERALVENQRQGKHAIIAIDEAHLLEESQTFETLRLLLNYEVDGRSLFTLLLVGQLGLLLQVERMPSFEERLGVKCLLRPFTIEETVSYVSHRLQAAGAKRQLFDNNAWEVLFELTHGQPRRINRLCDLALLIGYAEERKTISAAQLEAVSNELVNVSAD